jgi:hypothetical protein
LRFQGGHGSNREHTWRYWAWPLPVDGRLAFVCEWPEFGIDETRQSLDAALFTDALRSARPIWPNWDGGLLHIHQLGNGVVKDPPPEE